MTPIMLAVATDHQDPAVIKMLLEHGADPSAKSKIGDSALDWAHRTALPAGVDLLKADLLKDNHTAPAEHQEHVSLLEARDPRAAVQKTLPLIEKSSWEFFAQSGCVSCHAQSMTDLVVGGARPKGLQVDEKAAAERVKMLEAVYPTEPLLERMDAAGAMEQLAYPLMGLAANNHPGDRLTDAMVANIAAQQRSDGSWHVGAAARPPAEEGDIFRTAVCIRALEVLWSSRARTGDDRAGGQGAPMAAGGESSHHRRSQPAVNGAVLGRRQFERFEAARQSDSRRTAARWRLGAAFRSSDGLLCYG